MDITTKTLKDDNLTLYELKYSILSEFLGCDTYAYAFENLNERLANVLKGVLDKEAEVFLRKAYYRRDERDYVDFAQDLVMSRILEIYLIDYFKTNKNRSYYLNGCDKVDVLDTKNVISTEPDLITQDGSYIEIISDKFNKWIKNDGFDLRDNKFFGLLELSKNHGVYILAVNIRKKKYQMIKVDQNLNYEIVEKIKEFGYKDGVHIRIDDTKYKYF